MPANLPPEAQAKLNEYSEAKTPEAKIRALEEFLKVAPKHKGAENLLYWAKRRLAELKEELETERRKRKGGYNPFVVEKEGAAQVVLFGIPNSGKSSIIATSTRAKVEVSPRPFTTLVPVTGMLQYEDIQFQLVEAPPVAPNVKWVHRSVGLVKNADAVALVLDLSLDPIKQYKYLVNLLEENGVVLKKPKGRVEITKERAGGIKVVIMGNLKDASVDDVKSLLKVYKIYNATVKIVGDVTLDDVEKTILGTSQYKPSVIILNKADLPEAKEKIDKFKEFYKGDSPIIVFSSRTKDGIQELGRTFFELLDLVRVYTKKPNGDVADKPLVLKKGATVRDVAKSIHSRMLEGFKYAKVWGPSAKYPGERVGLDHEVADGDVIEIHYKG
ncbi:TGS domain-containing protein [Ignicoccus islandicus DSM 13165]|uniref:TGS domain-containing protein n=1 Tax=Ignicoccus islandicus DSM 13165 TaxID=940295 RepID=A0A0U3FZP4_9CREN|nr:TGS domain-containing protein [Ignicoccus islandicus]ALU11564.1 TGS domain-containing protein [Ignicoccus islandicus DSM 13165]